MSTLENFPTEVLEGVVLALVDNNLLGPPTDLPPLLRVSKTIHSKISVETNPSLYSRIFATMFDTRLVTRRLGGHRNAREKANELLKRFMALKRFKFSSCHEFSETPTAREDIWIAYLMFLEHEQNNYEQLVHYAGVNKFASEYVKPGGPFHNGTERNNGWKVDNEINALVAWIFWFTDKDRMATETAEDRQRMLNGLAHLFVGSFKYASTHAPITTFLIPPPEPPLPLPPRPVLTLAALPHSRLTFIKNYFGVNPPITHPLLTQAVFLICAVRLEAAGAVPPIHLPAGYDGPTIEEVEEQTRPTTKFAEWGEGRAGDYEHDWNRLITCYSPWTQRLIRRRVFTPGMLAGTWIGRLFEIPQTQFDAILSPQPRTAAVALQLLDVYPRPMRFHVWEYHQQDSSQTISFNDFSNDLKGEGVFKAWLPEGILMTEAPGHLHFRRKSPGSNVRESTYDLYDHCEFAKRAVNDEFARSGLFGHGVYDIILTARTDDRFGDIWGHKEYYGRVRAWDGLVVFVSVATHSEASLLFSGYIHGNQNLVGRWRETLTPVDQPGWEGVWSMAKLG